MRDVTSMTDAELSALIEESDLVAAARKEMERRRIEHDPNVRVVSFAQPSVKRTSKAPCPSCGRADAVVNSKTIYDSPDLAHGGNVVCTAAICGCGAWYDAGTGKPIDPGKAYTY